MKKIILKNRDKEIVAYAIVDDEDFEWLSKWRWCKYHGYAARGIRKKLNRKHKTVSMAVEIMKKHNLYNETKEIDHINRNKLDNQKHNLRVATRLQNNINRGLYKNNKSGYRGINFEKRSQKNPWVVRIPINGKLTYMGCFPTKEEAAKAYDEVVLRHYKEFAVLNFPRKEISRQ